MLALYRVETRQSLLRFDAMLARAQRAGAAGSLPPWLQAADVGGFLEHARGAYTLQHEADNIDRFRIPRPGLNFDNQQALIARFASGWSLVCIYPTPDTDPSCKGFDTREP